ncbi:pseudouridine synthase [Andreprevotia chitinilytica]|uniref:pseudouridine synthase n=1 Tax=Andreprevotia chitinilytica TaxID=396808 RepID=UPI000557B99F|nr:pseudouridine synthase [Andreprevotia chitinilytica]
MTIHVYQPPSHTALAPIFVDDHLVVLDKPAGLLAVPGRGEDKQDCLSSRIQLDYPDALIVHRLDMATSGLVVFARGEAAQRALGIAFIERRVDKRYVAVVAGQLPVEGEIDLPLMADWPNRPLQKVDAEHGKLSLTRYRCLAYDVASDTSRVELEPITGRTHQLRVHLMAIGHPIVGDGLYAGPVWAARADRLLLHAGMLALPHPVTGERMVFEAAVPF